MALSTTILLLASLSLAAEGASSRQKVRGNGHAVPGERVNHGEAEEHRGQGRNGHSNGGRHYSRQRFVLKPEPLPPNHKFERKAVSDWYFQTNQSRRVVIWTAQTFRNTSSRRHFEDASINLDFVKKNGPVQCRIIRASDQTDLRRRASVAASIAGTGNGQLQLTVAPSDPFVASGEYCTTVHVTVTAP